jgi:hypothetical protein
MAGFEVITEGGSIHAVVRSQGQVVNTAPAVVLVKENQVQVLTVRLRVVDLGFPEGALTREIIGTDEDTDLFGKGAPFAGGRYRQLGLELCPPDVGPHLRSATPISPEASVSTSR